MKILIVDDSIVFRSQIRKAIEKQPGLEVVGVANNGKICLEKLDQMNVDLITLDVEMPVLGGIETIKEIRKRGKAVKVILFSSHTQKGSDVAIEALSLGADDFVAKPSGKSGTMDDVATTIADQLLPKINQFLTSDDLQKIPRSDGVALYSPEKQFFKPKLIVIASSTGGPPALEKVFASVKSPLRCPVCIAQHMPPLFTKSLADRLERLTGVPAAEAKDLEPLENKIYVAPGNFHLSLKKINNKLHLKLDQSGLRNSVRPCADFLFETAAELLGPSCFAIVLTGMGHDGTDGAVAIKKKYGKVLVQDKESCAVFGMPMSVLEVGAADYVGNLEQIASGLALMAN